MFLWHHSTRIGTYKTNTRVKLSGTDTAPGFYIIPSIIIILLSNTNKAQNYYNYWVAGSSYYQFFYHEM